MFRVETDVSCPSAQRINTKCGFALSNSTLSTRGSLLLRINLFISTGPGVNRHAGKDLPRMERLSKHRNRSWRVWLVAVQNNDLTACKASGRIWSHCSSWRCLVRSMSYTVFHQVELRRSHWEFPSGWYGVVRLVATLRDSKNSRNSDDINADPRSLCT